MASVRDIAKALNISASTVSMVFNNKPGVSERTRQLVFETAQKLGYQQKVRTDNKSTIELMTLSYSGEFETPLFSQVIEGISFRAQEKNYKLMVSYYRKDSFLASSVTVNPDCKGVLLLISDIGGADFSILNSIKLPMVVLDKAFYDRRVDTVSANHIQGSQMATEYLISLGHTKLCFIQSRITGVIGFSERLMGYQQAVLSHKETRGRVDNVLYCVRDVDKMAEQIRELEEMPTAFVCTNDGYANICVQALHQLGYKVPEDVSVIGFDNIPYSEAMSPKLTTMNVPKQRMGSLAVDRLLDVIEGKTSGENVRIEVFCDLVIRESTAKPKGSL